MSARKATFSQWTRAKNSDLVLAMSLRYKLVSSSIYRTNVHWE
jgi:hypothetical protein